MKKLIIASSFLPISSRHVPPLRHGSEAHSSKQKGEGEIAVLIGQFKPEKVIYFTYVYLAEFAGESGLAVAEVLIDPVHADPAVHAGVTLTVV